MSNVTKIDGHIPNYVNPRTKQPLVMGVQIGMTATALLCVAMRLYTRKVLRNVFGTEDWVIIVAMVCPLAPRDMRMNSDNIQCLAIVATICTCLGCKIALFSGYLAIQHLLTLSRHAWWNRLSYLGHQARCKSLTKRPSMFPKSALFLDGLGYDLTTANSHTSINSSINPSCSSRKFQSSYFIHRSPRSDISIEPHTFSLEFQPSSV